MSKINQSELKRLLHYDPISGQFTCLVRRGTAHVGKVAGSVDGQGYINISIYGVMYCAHRLAWLYMTGEWPEHDVDHKDLVKSNNKWINLREASDTQNEANKPLRSDNTTGYKGVYRSGNRFVAQIKVRGKQRTLGYYASPEAAHARYVDEANVAFGAYARSS